MQTTSEDRNNGRVARSVVQLTLVHFTFVTASAVMLFIGGCGTSAPDAEQAPESSAAAPSAASAERQMAEPQAEDFADQLETVQPGARPELSLSAPADSAAGISPGNETTGADELVVREEMESVTAVENRLSDREGAEKSSLSQEGSVRSRSMSPGSAQAPDGAVTSKLSAVGGAEAKTEPEFSSPPRPGLEDRPASSADVSLGRPLSEAPAAGKDTHMFFRGAQPLDKSASPDRPSVQSRDRFATGTAGNGSEKELLSSLSARAAARSIELLPGEELWVIAKQDVQTRPAIDQEMPGCGALLARLPGDTVQVPVPLKHTAVAGQIDGYIATVDVTQQFQNPYDKKIEAVYVFPLPQNAAVNEFVMTVGERRIRGIIRERGKAEEIYAQARAQGHVASLLTQERPNIFTQKVANIEPGRQIDIQIRYFHTLQYDDGEYEFVFPMVVGPRFNPPGTTDGVAALPRGTVGSGRQETEIHYLAPKERSGHDVSVTVNINAGVAIEAVRSVNHAIQRDNTTGSRCKVALTTTDSIPNKDFVLRYRVAGQQIKTAMMTHTDNHGQYFTMMIYPPASLKDVRRSPMEMVFVLDCSGSMNGKPIEQAKAAIAHAMQQLTPRDTFQLIQFSNNSSQLGTEPVAATPENIRRGLDYLAALNGSGGTHMIEGIKAALDFPHDEGRFRLVSFMTDGFIGNEQQILETLADKLGASRVFSFGVGSSPNRYLMDRMAILGRGAVTYLSLQDDASEIMDRFQQRISHPAMTDLAIDFGDMQVTDVYPQRLPDLIVGRPVMVTGRFTGEPSTVTVGGRVDLQPASFTVDLGEHNRTSQHPGIAAVWARMKIADLLMTGTQQPDQSSGIQQLVTETALHYNLMSSFTAFVAVDSLSVTEGDFGTTVAVPVPVPDGVKYETTVTN